MIDAGLAYKVVRVNAPRLPLKFYEDTDAFKLFMHDVGLMGAMAETPAESILVGDNVFSEYKGAFTELYVFTQLKALGMSLYYHSVNNSTIEIDFITQSHNKVVPIEVKAEVNVKSKSLRTFIKLGSRVDVYQPIGTEVRVRMDQPTTGDQTVLAVLK